MTLQAAIYQHMCNLFSALTDYLMLCTDTPEQFDKTLNPSLLM